MNDTTPEKALQALQSASDALEDVFHGKENEVLRLQCKRAAIACRKELGKLKHLIKQ